MKGENQFENESSITRGFCIFVRIPRKKSLLLGLANKNESKGIRDRGDDSPTG